MNDFLNTYIAGLGIYIWPLAALALPILFLLRRFGVFEGFWPAVWSRIIVGPRPTRGMGGFISPLFFLVLILVAFKYFGIHSKGFLPTNFHEVENQQENANNGPDRSPAEPKTDPVIEQIKDLLSRLSATDQNHEGCNK